MKSPIQPVEKIQSDVSIKYEGIIPLITDPTAQGSNQLKQDQLYSPPKEVNKQEVAGKQILVSKGLIIQPSLPIKLEGDASSIAMKNTKVTQIFDANAMNLQMQFTSPELEKMQSMRSIASRVSKVSKVSQSQVSTRKRKRRKSDKDIKPIFNVQKIQRTDQNDYLNSVITNNSVFTNPTPFNNVNISHSKTKPVFIKPPVQSEDTSVKSIKAESLEIQEIYKDKIK